MAWLRGDGNGRGARGIRHIHSIPTRGQARELGRPIANSIYDRHHGLGVRVRVGNISIAPEYSTMRHINKLNTTALNTTNTTCTCVTFDF